MKAQELRIGNYVTIDNPICWLKLHNIPLLVTAVNEKMDKFDLESFPHSDGTVKLKSEYDTYGQFSQFIAPIELTEEWLFKFGFTKHKGKFGLYFKSPNDSRVRIYFYEDKWNIGYVSPAVTSNFITIASFIYVHKLQNFYFEFVGSELIIK